MHDQGCLDLLVEHSTFPRHRGKPEQFTVAAPGGNAGCGDAIVIYLRVNTEGREAEAVTFEGEGCTISQAAASLLLDEVQEMPLESIERMDYREMERLLGREAVALRPRCATLALGTLKAAIRRYRELCAIARGDERSEAAR